MMTGLKRRKGSISEKDISSLLQRYTATTILALLQEVAQFAGVRINWNTLIKRTSTGISSAREYQMLWRHLAYHDPLLEKLEDGAEPLDDDSDLDFELEAFPSANGEASAEAAACVKVLISSGFSSDSGPANRSTVEAPLTINIPNGPASRTPYDKQQLVPSTRGMNITVPVSVVSVQKQPLSTMPSVEGLEGNGPASSNVPAKKKRKPWTEEEDMELRAAVEKNGERNWANIVKGAFKYNRTASQLSQRWSIIKKCNSKAGSSSKPTSSTLSREQLAANEAVSRALNMPSFAFTSSSLHYGTNQVGMQSTTPSSSAPLMATPSKALQVAGPQALNQSQQAFNQATSQKGTVNLANKSRTTPKKSTVLGKPPVSPNPSSQAVVASVDPKPSSQAAMALVGPNPVTQAAMASEGPNPITQETFSSAAMALVGPNPITQAAVTSTGPNPTTQAAVTTVGPDPITQAAVPSVGPNTITQASVTSVGPNPITEAAITSAGPNSITQASVTLVSPNPIIQAAAFAAGGRIATPSTAASHFKAAQSKKAVHIRHGGATAKSPTEGAQPLPGFNMLGPHPSNFHHIRFPPPPVHIGMAPNGPRPNSHQVTGGSARFASQLPPPAASLNLPAQQTLPELKTAPLICSDPRGNAEGNSSHTSSTTDTDMLLAGAGEMKLDSSVAQDTAALPNLGLGLGADNNPFVNGQIDLTDTETSESQIAVDKMGSPNNKTAEVNMVVKDVGENQMLERSPELLNGEVGENQGVSNTSIENQNVV